MEILIKKKKKNWPFSTRVWWARVLFMVSSSTRKSGRSLYCSETVFLDKLFPKLMVMDHFAPHLILGSPKTFAKISKEACTPGPLGLFVTLLHGPPYHTSCKLTFLGNIKFDSKLLIQFLASMCVYIYIKFHSFLVDCLQGYNGGKSSSVA